MDEILLCSAAAEGNLAAMDALLKKGVSPNGRDQRGSSALSYAASFGQVDAAALLLEAGVDINARNLDGQTALSSIDGSELLDMITWLEVRGAMR